MKNTLFFLLAAGSISLASADTTPIGTNSSGIGTSPACNSNIAVENDPNQPPAGAYKKRNKDGTSDQIYSTGGKKIETNSNCGSLSISPIIEPYIPLRRK